MENTPDTPTFASLGLNEALLKAIDELGYEAPSPIQVKTIPLLLAGRDVIGQAQTGTGKTGAFALPMLQQLNPREQHVQALVLTPTRELAIQVAEAVFNYGKFLERMRVIPVYGGQAIYKQITRLEHGVAVVVGTPGRIIDHLKRGTLSLAGVRYVVLDEADEMLRMGFIEDIEWILAQAPAERQTALFSATMPDEIRRVADRYLRDPQTVEIEHKTLTLPTTRQRYIVVGDERKLDALINVLETEPDPGEAVLIFAQTKVGAAELAEKLLARGFAAEAMHGDMNQAQRENVVRRLRSGQLEIVTATDVAARGWDVERIGLVVNYDIPYDAEDYVHRIGRTGRAGRTGKAVLLVTPRQKRLLREIERYTGQSIEPAKPPTRADVAARRVTLFKESLLRTLDEEDLDLYLALVTELEAESGREMAEIAAAAARLARAEKPLELVEDEVEPSGPVGFQDAGAPRGARRQAADGPTVRLYMGLGRAAGIRPADIVGALANEADVPGREIGPIEIQERFSLVGVPAGYVSQVLERMEGATIRGREVRLRIDRADEAAPGPARGFRRKERRVKPKLHKKRPKA